MQATRPSPHPPISVAPMAPPPPPVSALSLGGDSGGPASVVSTSVAIAGGLATIAAATSATDAFASACALTLRLPGVVGVAVLRPDDHGLFEVAYSETRHRLAAGALKLAGAALHQRWTAGHAPDAPAHGLGPFDVPGAGELLVVPFARDDDLLGALVIGGRVGRPVATSKAERITAAAIGVGVSQALAVVALRRRLEQTITRPEHEAKLADERRRISHALHEGPTQELCLAGITLDGLAGRLGGNAATADWAATDVELARDLIDRAIHGMRATLSTLRTPDPKTPCVTGPLRELVAQMAQGPDLHSPEVEADFSQVSGVRLGVDVERALIGIVREALHDVRKHAGAESVQLEMRRDRGGVEVAVVDDGISFDGMGREGHIGSEQFRELAEGTGGRVDVRSLPGIGTSVRAWLPLPESDRTEAPSPLWPVGLPLDWGEVVNFSPTTDPS